MKTKLALHEALEAHELLNIKNLSITKSFTMSGLVQDEQLKAILNQEVESGTKFIHQLQNFLTDRSNEA